MITKKLFLSFPPSVVEQPIVYYLVKNFNLRVGIFRAKVTPEEQGYLVLEVSGKETDIEAGIAFVRNLNVEVNADLNSVRWDPNICVHCGNCVPHCPTEALAIPDRAEMLVRFDETLCIDCLSCIDNCPFGAVHSAF